MAFLAPLFLVALAAIGIPIAVHLTHRQRKEPVAFPSLMFLGKVEFRTTKRQRLRHPLLFALRTLAIVLLIAAFARPFVSSGNAATAGAGGGRDVVVLLDRSYSMRAGDRWARARAEAADVVAGLGPDDRATLVAFDARAAALAGPTADKGALRAALDAVRPGDAAARWAPAASLARSTLARAERPRREVVVVSDLQRGGWAPDESMRLPAGAAVRVMDVGGAAEGVAVTGIDFQRATRDGRIEVTATARLANRGADTARDVPVTLALEGREAARATARVAPSAVASVALGPFALPSAVVRGVVTTGDGAAGTGATRHFTLERGRPLRVLLASEADAAPGRTLYLRRALGVAGEPAVALEVVRGEVTMERLLAHDVVVLDDARPPRGQMARRLADWVAAGGGLLVTAGDRARAADWEGDLAGVRAATIGDVVDRMGDRGGRLGALDRTHPVLEPFAAPRSGNFSAPRFFRYRALAPAEGAATVARWDDGSPALVERRVGEGRVLFWGSTFDNLWNDLPLQPVFPPLVRQLVQHAAGWEAERPWHVVGDAFDAAPLARGADTASAAELVALAPSGRQVRLAGPTPTLALDEAGAWEVRRFGARGAPDRVLAVNVDAAELETGRIPVAEVTAVLSPGGGAAAGADVPEATLTPAERESRQSLWWFLLLGAAAAFAAEAVLANRIARKGSAY